MTCSVRCGFAAGGDVTGDGWIDGNDGRFAAPSRRFGRRGGLLLVSCPCHGLPVQWVLQTGPGARGMELDSDSRHMRMVVVQVKANSD